MAKRDSLEATGTMGHGPQAGESAPSVSHLPSGHPQVRLGTLGVLLVNLGTPDGTDFWSVRRYLNQFLSDKRVIDTPDIIWQPLLKGFILNTRPSKTGKAYKKVWRKDTNEGPLRYFTRLQGEAMQKRLDHQGTAIKVDWAMRYGQPSVPDKIQSLKDAGCDRIVVFALYPQYSATTTATVYDEVFRTLLKMRWQPAVRTVGAYHDDPIYIDALARSVEDHLAGLDWEPEVVIASFHGLPNRYFKNGDPYHCHCHKTARLLRERLGWSKDRLLTTFQSRFGPEEWLQPYTDETLEKLAKDGVKRVAVMTPGFVADCVETLEEIAIEGKEEFEEAGGEQFSYIPCLNESPAGLDVIETICRREMAGWLA